MRNLALIAIIVSILAVVIVTGASGLQPGPGHIRITDVVVGEKISNNVRVIKTLLYNKGITPNPIGNSILVCWDVGAFKGPVTPGSLECIGTYRFAHGNIQVAGFIGKRGLYTLAVVGGTGIYSNTGAGQMAAVTLDFEPREQQLEFSLYST